MTASVGNPVQNAWMDCVSLVHNRVVVPRPQTTRLQGVSGGLHPVGATALVYAGIHRDRPQSTALITAIDIHTHDIRNHPATASRNPL